MRELDPRIHHSPKKFRKMIDLPRQGFRGAIALLRRRLLQTAPGGVMHRSLRPTCFAARHGSSSSRTISANKSSNRSALLAHAKSGFSTAARTALTRTRQL
jgi:hypothetical protein